MQLTFTQSAYKDYRYWKRNDPRKAKRIQKLCQNLLLHPLRGLGKPEPLKYDLQGSWSRRIDRVHRLVYQVQKDDIIVISCRYHY